MLRENSSPSALPEGFLYQPHFITGEEERILLDEIASLDFQPFDFHGYIAKRRIVEYGYGYEYDFSSRQAQNARPLPAFLDPFRERAAACAGISADQIIECVVTEYSPGSPIGWHRDVPQFEIIIGISLRSSCRFRFKPYREKGKIVSLILEPRSAYIMRGPARWNFQHSIPAAESLRYSITFRTWRSARARSTTAKGKLTKTETAILREPYRPGA
ncbi:MAG TPA: alpha-ketoglutarate-dependent dioxygenase AlkB [Candidatus Sulfotelmatobacter sp.]|nr:alpha-ketoglutarate-dependent dioxygenase AlkB [Candidatus Sulfotelmatobacter sp.]